MSNNQEWISRQEKDDESRRAYEYERLTVAMLDEIAEAMERNGISKAEVARALGTSRANITQAFSGSRNLTVHSLSDLAWACGARLYVKWQPLRSGEFISTPVKVVESKRRIVTIVEDAPWNDDSLVRQSVCSGG